jgi:hypothetical protein
VPTTRALLPQIHWTEGGVACSALWRSERGAPPPKRVVLADDTTTADAAYTLACGGTALLWRGDFHNARQLLQALVRRIDRTPRRKQRTQPKVHTMSDAAPAQAFHAYRLAQSQRARVLAMVLLPFNADYSIALRRAPDARMACTEAWGAADPAGNNSVASLRDLMGMTSAHEWRKKGVEIASLGEPPPNNRIYPHYGVFSPVRGEYIALLAAAHLPPAVAGASESEGRGFDIGVGSGVLSAVLARTHGLQVVATDQDPRALACAGANMLQLGLQQQVTLVQQSMFPAGLARVIVCNPPWLPARPSAPVEHAVYDEGSRMLKAFLAGLAEHLATGGEGWLILSDLAEHLGLRTRAELLTAVDEGGLVVLGRTDAKPLHGKALDPGNALYAARSKEVTSLWRLGVKPRPAD